MIYIYTPGQIINWSILNMFNFYLILIPLELWLYKTCEYSETGPHRIFSCVPFCSSMSANSKMVCKISVPLLVFKWEAKIIKQFFMLWVMDIFLFSIYHASLHSVMGFTIYRWQLIPNQETHQKIITTIVENSHKLNYCFIFVSYGQVTLG